MIIMPIKEGENIERALKKFKRKYERTGVLKELRRRQYFTKPSIVKSSTFGGMVSYTLNGIALLLKVISSIPPTGKGDIVSLIINL